MEQCAGQESLTGLPSYQHPVYDPQYVDHVSAGRRAPSRPLSLTTGPGYTIYRSTIIPAIKSARMEVILVTCFWAPSATRDAINEALIQLSKKALETSCKISVQICFSSSSIARNLLWPTPKEGQFYPPTAWKKLGLPDAHELEGLDVKVVRKFFWPFGIIHSKYVIIDRKLAILPSCNVSWERWYEVAVMMTGPIVEHLVAFHASFWGAERLSPATHSAQEADIRPTGQLLHTPRQPGESPGMLETDPGPTTLLPSPHGSGALPFWLHPRALASQCPCIPNNPPGFRPTPLSSTTYHLLMTATSSIIMLTPNLTEPAILEAIYQALLRGVHVCIWTNRNLMTAEQLVTAGATTPGCIKKLKRRTRNMQVSLEVFFFDDRPDTQEVSPADREVTPVKLHAKVTIVDNEMLLLGSGNMDAASWRTSQELGILIENKQLVEDFKTQWKYGKL
ncbi:hypothetical protein LTR47_005170 [Exophiala xenobiotica]|nr:hypothetical protein LTR47_005170 [Exophiala xenobiotica]KAK5249701.1 hypothetical protein LTS06_005483 [Exophiala xenobiotica]KAK5259518.1 hypothetical protein LTR40_005847 [Exophiala xenobiotica]KAK5356873.1 hypothetical protein LTR61_000609 [Exophiala xenobiotica]KAK5377027.1 hypothetical protein LTR11_004692 [Exophiala xenobiotica]